MNTDKYFDKLMDDYYMVLINAWSNSVKGASLTAIKMLSDLKPEQRIDTKYLQSLEYVIKQQLGEDFANALDSKIKTFSELSYRLSSQENQFKNFKITFSPTDYKNIEMVKQHQVFWLRGHYNGSVADRLSEILTQSIENKWTKVNLSEQLQTHFSDILKGSKPYFEGLAEHTSLRVREFARLTNYEKCGAKYYQIVAVMDDRTSDICRALNGQIFPLTPALECMNEMFNTSDCDDYEEAKAKLKRLAPFINENQIEYNDDNFPIGIHGNHTPFPPFHWRCRTRTIMIKS